MNNMITKLSSVAALIGVIGAIGAGFVQYGKLTAKIEELDEREAVINQTVDLEPLQEKISVLEVQLIDRIKKVDDKIVVVPLWVRFLLGEKHTCYYTKTGYHSKIVDHCNRCMIVVLYLFFKKIIKDRFI